MSILCNDIILASQIAGLPSLYVVCRFQVHHAFPLYHRRWKKAFEKDSPASSLTAPLSSFPSLLFPLLSLCSFSWCCILRMRHGSKQHAGSDRSLGHKEEIRGEKRQRGTVGDFSPNMPYRVFMPVFFSLPPWLVPPGSYYLPVLLYIICALFTFSASSPLPLLSEESQQLLWVFFV